jgi:hypothetical protein
VLALGQQFRKLQYGSNPIYHKNPQPIDEGSGQVDFSTLFVVAAGRQQIATVNYSICRQQGSLPWRKLNFEGFARKRSNSANWRS